MATASGSNTRSMTAGRPTDALFDRLSRALAVLEAKSTSVNLSAGEAQGRRYADQLDVPLIFLSNGEEIWFCDKEQDAHFRKVETVFSQDDLARRKAARGIRRSPLDIPIDHRIAGAGGRYFQTACIETLCREMVNGRRKMLVEMATGTGKTRTAAALMKRLFEANWVTRALFVVDRNTLAIQAERLCRASATAALLSGSAHRTPVSGREEDYDRHVANSCERIRQVFRRIFRPDRDRRLSPQHLRPMAAGPGSFRRRQNRPHRHALHDARRTRGGRRRSYQRLAIRDTLRFFEVSRPTYSYSMREAIDDGYLVPYEIYRAMTARTAATDGFSVARNEIDWDALDGATRAESANPSSLSTIR